MKLFITGVAGFIGSNLAAYFLSKGVSVSGIDNFATGNPANLDRLAAISSNFQFFPGDVRVRSELDTGMTDASVVVHLAAQVSVQESFANYFYNESVNIGGFLNTVSAATQSGVKKFIYASSCAVYGDNNPLPLTEDSIPVPLSPYAVTKLTNDLYADVLNNSSQSMEIIGLRLFNMYGPWQSSEGGYAAVIPQWIQLIMEGKKPVIYGDGTATRDFCYISDLAELIYTVGTDELSYPSSYYNIGTGVSTSLNHLYETIRRELSLANPDANIATPTYKPWREGDIRHSYASASNARQDLGFTPKINLEEGIRRLLREQYNLTISD